MGRPVPLPQLVVLPAAPAGDKEKAPGRGGVRIALLQLGAFPGALLRCPGRPTRRGVDSTAQPSRSYSCALFTWRRLLL